MHVVRAFFPHFHERRAGTIINVAAVGSRVTFPLYSRYHGTKWAVKSFSESLQFELHPFNSRVKIVEPGPIKTGFCDRSMESMQKAGETAPGPGKVAEVIFRAATDGSLR